MTKFEQHEAALKIDGYYLGISNTTNVVEQFERAKREWLEYTLPAGTIVPVEIYTVSPDVVIIGNKFLVVAASDAEYFEVIE